MKTITFHPMRRLAWTASLATFAIVGLNACDRRPLLAQDAEARHVVADMRVQFANAVEASNRAVMADTDEASRAAASEARTARRTLHNSAEALRTTTAELGESDAVARLDQFTSRLATFETLDDSILELAVENTNLKAQRLSFGSGSAAADDMAAALKAATAAGASPRAELLAANAVLAVRSIQALQARHIAEADDAAMARMETEMAASAKAAGTAIDELRTVAPARAIQDVGRAAKALGDFRRVNNEIVSLSRRNSNVRSLALALGRKRTLTAECEDALVSLQEAVGAHEIRATR